MHIVENVLLFNNYTFFSIEFYRPKFQLTEWAMFPSIQGHIDYIYSPMFPSNYPMGINEYKTVQSFPGMYLKLTIIYASFAENETEEQLKNVSCIC